MFSERKLYSSTSKATVFGYSNVEVVLLSIALAVVLLAFCMFAPICYPLSLSDIMGIFCFWALGCDTNPPSDGEYINACEVMVC